MRKPVLVFDFDNTITVGDALDELIEAFSPNQDWRVWETAWIEGRLSARDCLQLQIGNLRVSRETLLERVASTQIDPWFARIVGWARERDAEVIIVSDSFLPLILHVLRQNAIEGIPVFANDLAFSADRLHPTFPYCDPSSIRSANAKARHLAVYRGRNTVVFAGDGRSDLDAALAADVVFAKDSLARELDARSVAYHRFSTLEPMLAYLAATPA